MSALEIMLLLMRGLADPGAILDTSMQLIVVTMSQVSLAHKMATAMSSSLPGTGTEEIKDILTEAQKLMGLAREERLQVSRQ